MGGLGAQGQDRAQCAHLNNDLSLYTHMNMALQWLAFYIADLHEVLSINKLAIYVWH